MASPKQASLWRARILVPAPFDLRNVLVSRQWWLDLYQGGVYIDNIISLIRGGGVVGCTIRDIFENAVVPLDVLDIPNLKV
jgi:hypothetical protein